MTTLTTNEAALIDGIRSVSDYGWYSDELHCYCQGIDRASIGGIVASLVKKKVVKVYTLEDDNREYVEIINDPRI